MCLFSLVKSHWRGLTWFYSHHKDSRAAAFHFGQVGSLVWIDHTNGTGRINAWNLHESAAVALDATLPGRVKEGCTTYHDLFSEFS
eukprot:s637_g44.t1